MSKGTVRVAVIGSGLTGLTAAYLLTRPLQNNDVKLEVHLYEKASKIGMDSSSVNIPAGDQEWRVDVPMRSFQGGYYPQLISFYRSLGVSFKKRNFSYSFSTLISKTPSVAKPGQKHIETFMIYNGSSGFSGVSMPSNFRVPFSPLKHQHIISVLYRKARDIWTFLAMAMLLLFCYLRTILYAMPAFRPQRWKAMTFGAWASETIPRNAVARALYLDIAWKDYTESTLLPLFSAVCTTSRQDILTHPVEEILDYIWLTLGTDHYVVIHGVQNVISKLKTRITHIHLSSLITAVEADPQDTQLASITYTQPDGTHVDRGFQHVIFATEANCAAPLLSSYAKSLAPSSGRHRRAVEKQVECLSSFKYSTSVVLNHTDRGLLPNSELDIRDLNFVVAPMEDQNGILGLDDHSDFGPLCVSPSFTMTTHVMLPPEGCSLSEPIFQTTNPIIPPKTDSLLSRATLQRAVLTLQAKQALKDLYQQQASGWWHDENSSKSNLGILQGAGRLEDNSHPGIWICGSYVYPGIPLLEGCVVSSRCIVEEGIFRCEGVTAVDRAW